MKETSLGRIGTGIYQFLSTFAVRVEESDTMTRVGELFVLGTSLFAMKAAHIQQIAFQVLSPAYPRDFFHISQVFIL